MKTQSSIKHIYIADYLKIMYTNYAQFIVIVHSKSSKEVKSWTVK